MSFTLIVKRPNRTQSYNEDSVRNAIFFFQNKYSVGTPFMVHERQVILLEKLGYNYLTRAENFGAFNKDFLLIFFTNGPVNINQYFYRDQIASEEQIYFNALNNYDVDYVYTNVAAAVRSYKNTLENIYSVQKIPLSFIDDTNIQYAYTRPHGVQFCTINQDPYQLPDKPVYALKEERNGQRYITDNYDQPLLFQIPKYNPSFDKLIIYNRGNPCRYMLMTGGFFYNEAVIQREYPNLALDLFSVQPLTRTNNDPEPRPTVYTGPDAPQIFDLSSSFNMAHKWTKFNATTKQILNGAVVLINVPGQAQAMFVHNPRYPWDFDLIEKASSTLCGNNSLVFNYFNKIPNQLAGTMAPRIRITRDNLVQNTEFFASGNENPENSIRFSEQSSATYTVSYPAQNRSSKSQSGTYLPYLNPAFTTSPDVYYTWSTLTKTWTQRVYNPLDILILQNTIIFEWSKTKYDAFTEWYAPVTSAKFTIIFNNTARDIITASSYIAKNINGSGNSPVVDITWPNQLAQNLFGFRSKKMSEYVMQDCPNIGSYTDNELTVAGNYWSAIPNPKDYLFPVWKYGSNLGASATMDARQAEFLATSLDINFLDKQYITSTHTIDDKPFSLGMRMKQNGFNYRNYFQFRHFPKYILKKTFSLTVSPTEKLPAILTTPTFQLNSLLVKNYSLVSCFMLPDLSRDALSVGTKGPPQDRGLCVKCSLSKPLRGQSQYLFLETGNYYIMDYQKFQNASTFNFEIFCPQVLPAQSTLFREINNTTNITIFLIFK